MISPFCWRDHLFPSYVKVEKNGSAISCASSRNPLEKALWSVMLCISSIHSSSFYSISLCLSVSVSSSSSRLWAASFSSSLSRLLPQVHYSKWEMLPHHNSLIVFIRISAYRNGDRPSEFSLGNTSTVLFHFCLPQPTSDGQFRVPRLSARPHQLYRAMQGTSSWTPRS